MTKSNSFAWFWPKVVDVQTAKKSSIQGIVASFFIAAVTVFDVVLIHTRSSGLVDVVIFSFVGWGIYKLSRVAAIAGLTLHLANRVLLWGEGTEGPGSIGMAALIALMFINSVRGTFAFHKLSQAKPSKN